MQTGDLIAALAEGAPPVRRLRPPFVRAAGFVLLAFVILALIAVCQGLRADLIQRSRDASFVLCVASALLTAITAAVAGFQVSLPDRSKSWLLLPLPSLAIWLATAGYQCAGPWVGFGPDGVSIGEGARCFATLVLVSLPLSLILAAMLRFASAVWPTPAVVAASLSVAGFTACGLILFHTTQATAMVLMWNFAVPLMFLALGRIGGDRLLRIALRLD